MTHKCPHCRKEIKLEDIKTEPDGHQLVETFIIVLGLLILTGIAYAQGWL